MGGGRGYVDDPAMHKGATVVDPNHDRASGAAVRHAYHRSEWERSMRGSHVRGSGRFSICRPAARVDRGDADLILPGVRSMCGSGQADRKNSRCS
jgi:hypothetical protein